MLVVFRCSMYVHIKVPWYLIPEGYHSVRFCYSASMACREKKEMSSAEHFYRKAVEANPAVSIKSHTFSADGSRQHYVLANKLPIQVNSCAISLRIHTYVPPCLLAVCVCSRQPWCLPSPRKEALGSWATLLESTGAQPYRYAHQKQSNEA